MEHLRQYIICVICAALICSILTELTGSGKSKELIKLLCGVFITICLLQPFCRIRFEDLWISAESYFAEADTYIGTGTEMSNESMTDIIKEKTEAYILEKAAQQDSKIQIEISLGNDYLPVSAVIYGNTSASIRSELEQIMESDLGITKENQRWVG